MNRHDAALLHPTLEQVYLIDRDSGLLCRILGLYAARGIDVQRAEYAYAAQDVMTLKVWREDERHTRCEVHVEGAITGSASYEMEQMQK